MPKAAIPTKDGELPAKNRPRTSTACLTCRKKRAKCDGEKPTCSSCLTSGSPCEYDLGGDKRKPYNKSVVQAMQLRIDSLERENAQLRDSLKSQGQPPGVLTPTNSGSPSDGPAPALVPAAGQGQFPKSVSMDAFQGGLALNIHGELRFFGPTSSFRSVLADSTGDTTAPPSPTLARLEAARTFSLTRAPLPAALPAEPCLPRRPPDLAPDFQARLMKLAFEHCFSQYSMVPEREFYYDLQHHPYERTHHYSPFLGNLVLAVGARYLDPDEDFPREICGIEGDTETRGDVWVAYSRYLLDQEWYNPKLSTIKGLLVLAMYMACRGFDGPCTIFNGLAMRLVEDFGMHLGIHRLAIGHGHVDSALNHARLHTFYAALQADIIASIYVGRRITFEPDEIDIELPPIIPELDYDPPMYRSSSFLWFSKLCLIGSRIMSKIYSLTPIALSDRQAAVPELHLALENWYHELPGYLRANMTDPSKAPHQHIIALNAAYHMLHIQLHRPFFRRTSKEMPTNVSTDKCLSAAQSLVRIIKLLRGQGSLRFTAPGVQHAIFCGGTILALSAVEDGISETPQQDASRRAAAKQDLNTIIEALKEMGITWTTAQTAAAILEALATQWQTELPTVEQIQDHNWQPHSYENNATASFSYIFPSFDLDPLNQLDFGSLLHPLPSSVDATPVASPPSGVPSLLSPYQIH